MKKLVVGSFAFVLTLMLAINVFATTYDVTEYDGENGLERSVATGDVLNLKNDIAREQYGSAVEVLGTYWDEQNNITINGNGYTMNGGGYEGFLMTNYDSSMGDTSRTGTIKNATLTNYSAMNNAMIQVNGDSNGLVTLNLEDVNLINNAVGVQNERYTELNIISNGTVEISSSAYIRSYGTLNFKGGNINISSTTLDLYGEANNSSNLTVDSSISGDGYIYNYKTMNIGGDASGFGGDIYVDNGTINVLEGGTYFNGADKHYYSGNSVLNLVNETMDDVNMDNLVLSRANIKMNIDVDLEQGAGDHLNVEDIDNNDYPKIAVSKVRIDDFTPISKIVIDKINILTDNEEEVSIEIANEKPQEYIHLARNKAFSTYYGYNVKISSSGSTPGEINIVRVSGNSDSSNVDYGNVLTFSRIDDKARNPELLQSKVAIAGSNISQDEIFTTVFNNAGNYTFFQKQGTAAGDVEDRAAPTLWVKAFGSKEDVDLEEYTTVETTYYGAVVGLDWDRQYTDNFDATYGVFASYVGGELKDDDWDNKVKQSGGYIGARANWYFGKLFVNGMIDYALIQNTADTTDDSNDFNSQVAGLAARVGYNFEVANKSFTIQPNLGLTGKYIITDDYDTIVDGNKIKLSIDNITNITIEPGLKLAKNLGKCWILTGEGKYVIENVSGDVTADDIVLPDTSYDNFANVGLGIEKIWGYTVLNLKANKTFGGRDGFIINAGIEFKF